jgi:hypothetical protein
MISKEEDAANTLALLRMQRDGYKNSADALAARLAFLESGDGDARVRELTEELEVLRQKIDILQNQVSQQAEDAAHKLVEHPDYLYYKRKSEELEGQHKEILAILGHANCDGLDHTYDWDF